MFNILISKRNHVMIHDDIKYVENKIFLQLKLTY
jgi:hypothetical protein